MLLVLFVMFISSLLGLLVSQYVRDMITISGLFKNYYTTYFYAYGGLELGLSQINYRVKNDIDKQSPFGYEDSTTFSGYSYCGEGCSFSLTIEGRGNIISDTVDSSVFSGCADIMSAATTSETDSYRIGVGDGFIVPLFYDQSTGFAVADYNVIDDTTFISMSPELHNDYVTSGTGETYIIKIIDEEVENYDVSIEPSLGDPTPNAFASGVTPYVSAPDNKDYLIIANATGSVKDFCLELGSGELPSKYLTIQSIAVNNSTTVSFGAIKTNELPSYLIYGTINP